MRTRITATVAALVVVALTGAGAIVYAIESGRVEDQMAQRVDQELAELGALQQNGEDPGTGRPFADVGAMLDTFLARNVPDDNELLVTWYDGRPQYSSPKDSFADSALLRDTVTPLVRRGGSDRIDIPSYGEALVTVQTVRSSSRPGPWWW